jgi:hypothetical protein
LENFHFPTVHFLYVSPYGAKRRLPHPLTVDLVRDPVITALGIGFSGDVQDLDPHISLLQEEHIVALSVGSAPVGVDHMNISDTEDLFHLDAHHIMPRQQGDDRTTPGEMIPQDFRSLLQLYIFDPVLLQQIGIVGILGKDGWVMESGAGVPVRVFLLIGRVSA